MVERAFFDKLIGTTLGNYRLEQLLGQDKQGPVFVTRADAAGITHELHLLITPADLTPDARIVYLGRFQQEANRVTALHHPHILPLLDYGTYQGMPYLVVPHVPMTSLRTLLAQHGPPDVVTVGRYLDQIAAALEYAHQHAVLHRNLSTDCIFIQSNNQLVVAQFGLLRMLELSGEGIRPYEGSSESSAPEQLLGKPVDTSADIYALGAVLYRLLTGHPPFTGSTREEIAQQHIHAQVPRLSTWRTDLPADLNHIIARAMTKEPTQRFRQPRALADAYHQIVAPRDATRTPFVQAQQQSAPVMPPPVKRNVGVAPLASTGNAMGTRSATGPQVSRRRLITLLAAGGGVGAVAVVLFGLRFLTSASPGAPSVNTGAGGPQPPVQGGSIGSNVLAHTSDVPVNSAKAFPIANKSNPGLLVHLSDDRFVAFDSTCTHTGCAVAYNPQDKLLECPCHGSTFDPAKSAAVVNGPAQTPLASVKIVVNADGTITTG